MLNLSILAIKTEEKREKDDGEKNLWGGLQDLGCEGFQNVPEPTLCDRTCGDHQRFLHQLLKLLQRKPNNRLGCEPDTLNKT